MEEIIAHKINLWEEYEQYNELNLSMVKFNQFKMDFIQNAYEEHQTNNPDSTLSVKSFRKQYNRILHPELCKPEKYKLLTFTVKLNNKYIICQRLMYLNLDFELTCTQINKVALLIDEFLYPKDKKHMTPYQISINFEYDDKSQSYDFPVFVRKHEKINIKPIIKDIGLILQPK